MKFPIHLTLFSFLICSLAFSKTHENIFTNVQGRIVNLTEIRTEQLRVKLTWTRFLSLSIGDGCKKPVEDSLEVVLDENGGFKFPQVGSNKKTVCKMMWTLNVITPEGQEIGFLDNYGLNLAAQRGKLNQVIEKIHFVKAPTIEVSATLGNGQIPTPEQLNFFDVHLFGDLNYVSDNPPRNFYTYTDFLLNQTPQFFSGKYIAWSQSRVKGVDLRISTHSKEYPKKEWTQSILLDEFDEIVKIHITL